MTCIDGTISVSADPCIAGEQPKPDSSECEVCPLNSYKTADDASINWRSNCTACEGGLETINKGTTNQSQCLGMFASSNKKYAI